MVVDLARPHRSCALPAWGVVSYRDLSTERLRPAPVGQVVWSSFVASKAAARCAGEVAQLARRGPMTPDGARDELHTRAAAAGVTDVHCADP
ncbi:hypothetical protein [Modestobacter sp. URMC 112]